MNVRNNVRDVAIGLVTGASITLAMAPARERQQPAGDAAPVVRYQITATRDNLGNEFLIILDHQTQKLHRVSAQDLQGRRLTVPELIRDPET
jgi:hypothetical protein